MKVWSIISLYVGVVTARNTNTMGPFDIMVRKIMNCEKVGTGDIGLSAKLTRVNKTTIVADFNLTLKVPYDDEISMVYKLDKEANGAYVKNYVNQRMSKACTTGLNVTPQIVKEIFGAMKVATKCPLKEGFYSVKDFYFRGKVTVIPTFFYGKYRMNLTFYRRVKAIGCFIVYMDVVPRREHQ